MLSFPDICYPFSIIVCNLGWMLLLNAIHFPVPDKNGFRQFEKSLPGEKPGGDKNNY